jgi:hypothetical protein
MILNKLLTFSPEKKFIPIIKDKNNEKEKQRKKKENKKKY